MGIWKQMFRGTLAAVTVVVALVTLAALIAPHVRPQPQATMHMAANLCLFGETPYRREDGSWYQEAQDCTTFKGQHKWYATVDEFDKLPDPCRAQIIRVSASGQQSLPDLGCARTE